MKLLPPCIATLPVTPRRKLLTAIVISIVAITFGIIVSVAIYLATYNKPIPLYAGSGSSASALLFTRFLSHYATDVLRERRLKIVPVYRYDANRAVQGGWDDIRQGKTSFFGLETNDLRSLSPAAQDGDYEAMPLFKSAVAIGFKVPECPTELAVTLENLALIFAHHITYWDDSRLVADAPCLQTAHKPIDVLFRTSPSAATYLFIRTLRSTAVGATLFPEATMTWPNASSTTTTIPTNDYMLFQIYTSNYSIGYLPWSNTDPSIKITYLSLIIGGNTVHMSPASVEASREALALEANPEALPPASCTTCWPLLGTTYVAMRTHTIQNEDMVVNATLATSCFNLHETAKFLLWVWSQPISPGMYARLPENLLKNAKRTIQNLSCNGRKLWNTNYARDEQKRVVRNAAVSGFGVVSFVVSIGLLIAIYNEYLYRRDLKLLADVVGETGALDDEALDQALLSQISSDHTMISLEDNDYDDHSMSVAARRMLDEQDVTMDSVSPSNRVSASSSASSSSTFSTLQSNRSTQTITSQQQSTIDSRNSTSTSRSSNQINLIPVSSLALGKLLGSGSFGDVLKAKYNNRSVAVKRIAAFQNTEIQGSFLAEIRAMIPLEHPYVLKLIGVAIQAPYTYIVSQYCKRGSLEDYMKRHQGTVSFQQRLEWMRQTAQGMAYLHANQITHRDLKLSNILLDGHLEVKIADLGTASIGNPMHRTRTGTLDHTAPEILDGRPYDQSCDVYSFAICMWQLFSGMPLYPQHTMFDIISKVTSGERPSLELVPSKRLASIIEECWHQDPMKRPSFEQLIEHLAGLTESDFVRFG